MKADLHCHTVLSDGAMRVDQIIPYAKRIGLDYIAISDHESTHSIPEAVRLGKELGVHAIPAVEANAWHEETQTNVHILCYYPIDTDRLQHSLSKDLKKLSDAVTKSYQSLMDEYPITMDQLYEVSKESTGVYYTHIMQVLSMMDILELRSVNYITNYSVLAALINFHTAIWMQKRSRIFFIPAEALSCLHILGSIKLTM